MIVTCVYIHVKPGMADAFMEATMQNHRETRKEPGNIRFDFIRQDDQPDRFMLYEVFESEKDIVDHKNTPHYLKWRDSVQDLMAEQRYGVKHNIIAPAERTKW
jgi:(4S)-4-hydroxy-5-phosphonooxypentane-2,3-dione isomerase